jgi:curved DNA-binding protein CbpA
MAKPDEQIFLDYYAVLDVEPAASDEEIKRAYRHLAKLYHPDLSLHPEATERFLRIQQAYEVLSDPVRRTGFDLLLKRRQEPASASPRAAEQFPQTPPISPQRPYLLLNLRGVGSADIQFRGENYALSARQVRLLRDRGVLRGKTAVHGDYLLCYCTHCHALFGGSQERVSQGRQPEPQELFPACPHWEDRVWSPGQALEKPYRPFHAGGFLSECRASAYRRSGSAARVYQYPDRRYL